MSAAFSSTAKGVAAWTFLDTLDLDIACVQEANQPNGRAKVIWKPIGGTRRWGSGVVAWERVSLSAAETAPLGDARAIQHVEESHPGAVAIGRAAIDESEPVTIISMYGLMYRLANKVNYSTAALHRMLSDLTPLIDIGRRRKRVILAGDWNVSPQMTGPSAKVLFDRIKAFGLVDCLGATHDGYVQTYRPRRKPTNSWQLDWVFASPALRLLSCEPLDTAEVRALSDHSPVVAEFEINGG